MRWFPAGLALLFLGPGCIEALFLDENLRNSRACRARVEKEWETFRASPYGNLTDDVWKEDWKSRPNGTAATVPADWWYPARLGITGGDPALPEVSPYDEKSANLSTEAASIRRQLFELRRDDPANHSEEIASLEKEHALVEEAFRRHEADLRQRMTEIAIANTGRFRAWLKQDLENASLESVRENAADVGNAASAIFRVVSRDEAQWLLDRWYVAGMWHVGKSERVPGECPA